jgi:uncharacterized protein (TIRG00374 family)
VKIRWKQVRQWLPGVLVSLLAVFLVFRLAKWEDLVPALLAMDRRSLILAVGLFIASMLLRAYAWWILLQRRASYPKTTLILNEGYLLNNLFPFRLGELGRAVFMSEAAHTSVFYVLSTIMLERLIDVAMAAVLLLVSIPLVLELDWARPAGISALLAVTVGLAFLFALARSRERWQPWVDRQLSRWPAFHQTVRPWLDSLLDGFAVLNRPGQFFLALAAMLVSWGLAITQYTVLIRGILPEAEPWWGLFVLGVAAVGVALPSAPASLGVFEASIVGGLALIGVPGAIALAFAILAHLIHVAVTGVIGLYGFYKEGQTINGIYRRLMENRTKRTVSSES